MTVADSATETSDPLLAGVRVVEIAHPLTEHGGRILAGLGAEVLLIEPPAGALTRQRSPRVPGSETSTRGSIAFLARNASKKSVVLDPTDADDAAKLAGLIARSEIVLDADTSLFHHLVQDAAGDAARITVTDEFGLGNSSIVAFGASGGMACSGWPGKEPVDAPSWLAHDSASIHAALMAAIALLHRDRSGARLDYEIPLHEAAIASIAPWTRPLHAAGLNSAGQGVNPGRLGAGPYPIFEASDGYVKVVMATPRQWGAFVELLGSPDEFVEGPWAERRFRDENLDAFLLICSSYLADRTVDDLFHTGQQLGLTITPVYTMRQFHNDRHVMARQLFVEVDDPEFGPVELMRVPLRSDPVALTEPPTPAPALGAHDDLLASILDEPERRLPQLPADAPQVDPVQPLTGLRLLQLGSGAVVPEASSVFALLGGDVIRIESRANPDFLRRAGGAAGFDAAPTYNQLNMGVRSMTVDMRETEGLDLVRGLVEHSDAVVENMRAPVVSRWGLDYQGARRFRDDTICVSSQGLGHGPYYEFQSFGPNLSAFCGAVSQWAHPDDPYPVGASIPHPDHVAGKQAFVALIAAMRRRDHTGAGCFIEAAQVEAPAYLIADRFLAQSFVEPDLVTAGNRSDDMAPHGCYPCLDDQWVTIAVETDEQWQALALAIGGESLNDPSLAAVEARFDRAGELDKLIAQWSAPLDVATAESTLRAAGVPSSRVVDGNHMAVGPGNETDGFFAPVDHPVMGSCAATGVPVKTADGRRPPALRAPLLGEHTDKILSELLRVSDAEIIDLNTRKIVGF